MSLSVAKPIATAIASSRLYYCNFPFHNIVLKRVMNLQRVHNYLARVFTRSLRFSNSVSLLKSMHWLPVRYPIIFKINHLYRSNQLKTYFHKLLTPVRQLIRLRSSNYNLLILPLVLLSFLSEKNMFLLIFSYSFYILNTAI